MAIKLPKLIATSVVRGSQQGESHGGVFTIDFEQQEAAQRVDWNTDDIDWEGRGADRGLRGIAFDGDDIYIAASDELFVYDLVFRFIKIADKRFAFCDVSFRSGVRAAISFSERTHSAA